MTTQLYRSREIVERVFITGTLTLETPAHFGNGDADGLTDIPLLRDPLDRVPLLTGASIAGALRNYLRETELGYGTSEKQDGATRTEQLFGHIHQVDEDKASYASWLMVEDALGRQSGIELRDGVAIQSATRTAEDNKKFDVELLAAGTQFDLGFELLLTEQNRAMLDDLAAALQGLEEGKIGLGQRKRRGYGQCRVSEWQVRRFEVATTGGLLNWLEDQPKAQTGAKIVSLLGVQALLPDARKTMGLAATFRLDSSLLIRSGSGIGSAADMVHLRSKRQGKDVPILSGTSLAGVMRARASRILQTLNKSTTLVDGMFGKRIQKNTDAPSGSRVIVRESEIVNALNPALVQSRVKLDRFTGGAFPQALFSEQPVFDGGDTQVTISVTLHDPKPAEVGLLLFVLKDMWTGDLPLGGESSVGRGRMSGISAEIKYNDDTWIFAQKEDRIEIQGSNKLLEECVQALKGAQ